MERNDASAEERIVLASLERWKCLTLRHYLGNTSPCNVFCHPCIAVLDDAKIEQLVILPSIVGGHSLWGYVYWFGHTDWVPEVAVHSYFVVTLGLYVLGLVAILTLRSQVLKQGTKSLHQE